LATLMPILGRIGEERRAWVDSNDALDILETGIEKLRSRALELRAQAVDIMDPCRIHQTDPEAADPPSGLRVHLTRSHSSSSHRWPQPGIEIMAR
jgi:hypothetical protein